MYAQAALAGIARDTAGAVLPGVTVEAASPVLIEKVRNAVTDSTGRYTIPNLRPGTYQVTFTLPGFRTVVREGIELTGSAVGTVNAELTVGGVQETITVSGETPIVDLQSTTRQAVMDQEIVSAIPSSRTPFTTGVLIPGVKRGAFMSQDVGGSVVQEVASLEANGGRTADQRLMVNGVALSSMIGGGWGGGAVPNATGTAEFAIDVSAVDAQAATGGVRINFIPRDGGNQFSGTIFGSYADENFASDNFTGSDVQERGLSTPGKIKANGDFNPGFGGPIARDKVWFFLSARALFADNFVPAMYFNENVNKLDRYDYVASPDQAILHQEQRIAQGRFTWQVNPKNKLGVTVDYEDFCACTTTISPTVSPEAGVDRRFPLQRFVTADWNTPVSNRILVEASAIHRVERWGGMHPQEGKLGNIDGLTPGIVAITDNPSKATGASLSYRANTGANAYNNSWNWNIHYRAAVSYITGSHAFKVGFNNAYGHYDNTNYADPSSPLAYTFANGVPNGITYRLLPRKVEVNVNRDLGLFAQDKWTTGRWTLSGGIRFDSYKNSFPPQSIVGNYFGRQLNIQYDTIDNLNWKDITPKLGATYDVFGNGKTALKLTLNKYLAGLGTTGNLSDPPNPIN
ncbi:MAG TPA: carboxypeptidase regulatory-like domain-containing protein, partial [Vicinamibacterales bacterium]|nr:carboxypeptidase regulatory-like domain-containing protein [Vicinamibacterales bacterium]